MKLRIFCAGLALFCATQAHSEPFTLAQTPIFVNSAVPPLNMLVMGRDHKLFYEAYNDASDLNGDGVIDVGYKGYLPVDDDGRIDYYGYFNSNVCYTYDGNKFTPSSAANDKQCSNKWSGDFLNYLTTSRMDALRKVLYGGYRATDTANETVLQAAFIPQDAHTWGKEYYSEEHDGYDISRYTPLDKPVPGFRHLFAVVSLTDGGIPQLRTLTNTPFRIWNWVSQERPVAGDQCTNSTGTKVACTSAKADDWTIVPAGMFSDLTISTWRDNRATANNEQQMNTNFSASNQLGNLCGTGSFNPPINTPSNFNNPFAGTNSCTQDSYQTKISGKLIAPVTGTYHFSVDGDDAVDFLIEGTVIANRYGNQGAENKGGVGKTGTRYLEAGKTYTITLRHEENSGDASFRLYWKTPESGSTTLVNRNIRVSVCPQDANLRDDNNCTAYADGNYKPTGILHDYGATDKMFFGLLTGSYAKNLSGGVLRSQLQSFSREFDSVTGRFCTTANACNSPDAISSGIVDTINKLRVIDFSYSNHVYGCGWITNRPITQNDTCYMWGNPIGEMMYETMRYFAGATGPTPEFNYTSGRDSQSPLNLPKENNWTPPYNTAPQCSAPVMTVISDINPSYDYKLPGSNWGAIDGTGNPSSIRSLNVSTEVDKIWVKEGSPSGPVFIGESNGVVDGAPTAKNISNFSTIRGLAPEEPTKQGTYYSAAIAHFGANNKIGGDQKLQTYAVALASPLPTFEFPVGGNTVTVVPFAKSVGGDGIDPAGAFQPTNQIVDFYIETIANTDSSCPDQGRDCDTTVNNGRPYAKFRINFEDVEQGADHDMDAIALYELMVNEKSELVINMTSEYAAGGIDQHLGYVISGTDKDGIYLEVKDQGGTNRAYKLDTPEGKWAGECVVGQCNALSRLSSSRTFTVSGNSSANFLPNPLWYAAKYGTNASKPDSDGDGVPDNYFLVTNALTLKDQLAKAFNNIMQSNASVSRPAVSRSPQSPSTFNERDLYRTEFDAETWTGKLIKETLDLQTNTLDKAWEASIPASGRKVYMANASGDDLQSFSYSLLSGRTHNGVDLQASLDRNDGLGIQRVNFIRGETGHASFRKRTVLLGDIVNSSPVLVDGAQYLPYLADQVDGQAQYADFAATTKNRAAMIYVGANDGMLHGFDAESGEEKFAFVPTPVIENLYKLTQSDYVDDATDVNRSLHQYYVDGSLSVADVYLNNEWRTVLVGTLGAGGRGAFALDITDPDNIDLLWEFTVDSPASKASEDASSDLGHVFGAPVISRLHNGKWGVLLNNGYNSPNAASGNAALFVLDVADGDVMYRLIANNAAGHNGLSAVKAADNNGDGIADYAYAGDLQGNMWRFDLFGTKASSGTDPFNKALVSAGAKVSYSGKPLYQAVDPSGKTQPITVQPNLVRHPSSKGYIVVFGTGRYLADTDKVAPHSMQSMYGIWDANTLGESVNITSSLTRANLLAQNFTYQAVEQIGDDGKKVSHTIRLLSENQPSWWTDNCQSSPGAQCGWYLDLGIDGAAAGERMVDTMEVRGEVLFFSTRQPSDDPCMSGLDAWNYGINPATGGRTSFTVFDLNYNRTVGIEDNYVNNNGAQVISGFKTPPGGFAITDGKIINPDGTITDISLGATAQGRQSWYILPAGEAE